MNQIPAEQLEAIANFWAEQYQFWAKRWQQEVTPEQLERFKSALSSKVEQALQEYTWDENNPQRGAYNRRFIASTDYHPSPTLTAALIEAGLKSGVTVLPWGVVLSIDPGSVTTHPKGEIVWQAPPQINHQPESIHESKADAR